MKHLLQLSKILECLASTKKCLLSVCVPWVPCLATICLTSPAFLRFRDIFSAFDCSNDWNILFPQSCAFSCSNACDTHVKLLLLMEPLLFTDSTSLWLFLYMKRKCVPPRSFILSVSLYSHLPFILCFFLTPPPHICCICLMTVYPFMKEDVHHPSLTC